ncbi:Heat shock 70 kDa protein [Armadillidium vulgare]|nr:Heat shock 70 kDa protein [Armadillidium vulgare]
MSLVPKDWYFRIALERASVKATHVTMGTLNLAEGGGLTSDTKLDYCYAVYRDGQCSNPSTTPTTKSACCCCSVILGQPMGWGIPCQACPQPGSKEFSHLCPHGPGITHEGDDVKNYISFMFKKKKNINECAQNPAICRNGACENLKGSYRCICNKGYSVDESGRICEDINECAINNLLCDGDNRKGSCWTKVKDGRCENNLPKLTLKSECCCTIGKAWGSPCEICNPAECDCPIGFAKVDGKTCLDIDECLLNPLICQGGGQCVNTEGSFTCNCPPGLTLDETKTKCLDLRKEVCYIEMSNGVCSKELEGRFHKATCCCTVGRGWGSACEECPRPGTEAFDELCPKSYGYDGRKDVNECTVYEDMCENGRCRNSIGSFSCRCNQGYALDEDGIKCTDIDECGIMRGVCGNGTCENTDGSFICNCNQGFESTMVMQVCMDINECERIAGICRGGRCINTPGSFSMTL